MNHWQTNTDTIEPWYRQFWPWFLMALPATVVVAGLSTWFIAAKNSDSLVIDDYYKQGLGINRQLAEDRRAQQWQITADMRIDAVVGEIMLIMQGEVDSWPQQLQLQLIHPTASEQDLAITVNKVTGNRYLGQLPQAINGRWYVQLNGTQPAGTWRLRGEIQAAQGQWYLQ